MLKNARPAYKRPPNKQTTLNPFLRALQYIFSTFFATSFLSLLLIYIIRLHKTKIATKRSNHQAYLVAMPPHSILAKSKKIFAAFKEADDGAFKLLLDSIDPETNPEEHLKVLYDYNFVTKPHLAHLIISSARIDTLRILLDSNLIKVDDHFLLHHVIKNLKSNALQLDILQLILDHEADLNLDDNKGFPPVAVAILYANLPALKFLISNKAKINVAFARSPSFLHYAVTRPVPNHIIIQYLLINGANVFHYGPDGRTPFHLILTMRPYNPSLIELLISNHASHIEKADYIKKLLNYPTNPKKIKKSSESTRYGYTPLHIAVAAYNTKLVQLLLAKGANPQIIDTSRLTPIELAKQLKQQKMIKIFEEK